MSFGNVEQNFDEDGIRQEERERVLDYLLKRVTEIDHSEECMMGYHHECCREDCTTCTIEFVVKELRQGGE